MSSTPKLASQQADSTRRSDVQSHSFGGKSVIGQSSHPGHWPDFQVCLSMEAWGVFRSAMLSALHCALLDWVVPYSTQPFCAVLCCAALFNHCLFLYNLSCVLQSDEGLPAMMQEHVIQTTASMPASSHSQGPEAVRTPGILDRPQLGCNPHSKTYRSDMR